jgi:glycerol-3-phosphate dehydrogenase
MGGKWTIYRAMGEDTINTVVERFNLRPTYESRTHDLRLIGSSDDYDTLQHTLLSRILPGPVMNHLIAQYGTRALDVTKLDGSLNK